jgi:hypothetical protein
MVLFIRKTTMEKCEAALAALQKRASLLADKKISAQKALDDAVAERQAHMIQGDLSDETRAKKLQGSVDSAQSALLGIIDAITALENRIADAEAALNAESDRLARVAASEALAAQIMLVDEMIGPWVRLTHDLATGLEAIHWHFESGQMAAYIRNVASEVQTAAAITSKDLRASVEAILAGRQAIPRSPVAATPTPSSDKS